MRVGDKFLCNVNFLEYFEDGIKYQIDRMNDIQIRLVGNNQYGRIRVDTNRVVFNSRINKNHFTKIKEN